MAPAQKFGLYTGVNTHCSESKYAAFYILFIAVNQFPAIFLVNIFRDFSFLWHYV